MGRYNEKIKQLLEKSIDSALLAVEIYNKPRTAFRSGGYIVLMGIAWLSLFHAIFERNKIKYFYKRGNRYQLIDGERKAWELSECIGQYYEDKNPPERNNLEFFIKLRNKIEHRFLPKLDIDVFGECQAMLINFENLITSEFGDKYAVKENLVFALQFSSILQEKQQVALKIKESKDYKNVRKFIENYKTNIGDAIRNSLGYSFKVFLIPKVGSHEKSSDVAIEFVKYDPQKPEEMEKYQKFLVAIKEKQVPMQGLRAGQVCDRVSKALKSKMPEGWIFNPGYNHVKCWKYYRIRPSKNSPNPEKTNQQYCFYNSAFNQYEYTEIWVNFLINELSKDDTYKKIMEKK
ncbi:MAG TPA: DUF3644 domain-containing protein [Ignavibacteria bacterium]